MKNYNNFSGNIDSIYCGSAVDGKGLRVVIFTNGCNLRCPFCHNPETLFEKGKEFTVEEVVKRVLRYKNYIKNGGVTISGGEPFLQPEFVLEIINRLKSHKIKTVIETNGTIINEDLIDSCDYLIVDVKNQLTDDLTCYHELLKRCKKLNKTVELTSVIVPTLNDSKKKILLLRELKDTYKDVIRRIKLLPFRKLCEEKYQKLNREFLFKDYPECEAKTIENLTKIL